MPEPKTSRSFQERFLDGYDRSQLRLAVGKVKPRRFSKLRHKYATLALGASLALGGIGVPLKIVQQAHNKTPGGGGRAVATMPIDQAITGDLQTAKNIAEQVAGGVAAVAKGVEQAASAPLEAVAEAPKKLAPMTEVATEHFFKTQVPFGSIIYKEAKKNDVRPELVAAVIQQESRFKPTARSHRGAQGLMQLVPKTGRWMGANNLMNPAENISAGAKYLKYLDGRFNGNETKVIAAYNAGEGNVRRFGGIPPFKETQKYVRNVREFQRDYAEQLENHVADVGGTLAGLAQ